MKTIVTALGLAAWLMAVAAPCGAQTLKELQTNARIVRITNAGLAESHPHDVNIVKEAPNYKTN